MVWIQGIIICSRMSRYSSRISISSSRSGIISKLMGWYNREGGIRWRWQIQQMQWFPNVGSKVDVSSTTANPLPVIPPQYFWYNPAPTNADTNPTTKSTHPTTNNYTLYPNHLKLMTTMAKFFIYSPPKPYYKYDFVAYDSPSVRIIKNVGFCPSSPPAPPPLHIYIYI